MKQYYTVHQLFADFGYFTKKSPSWRILTPTPGAIHGLPGSRGMLVAAGGVECAIIRRNQDGREELFFGHIANFIADKEEPAQDVTEALNKALGRPKGRTVNLDDYINLV